LPVSSMFYRSIPLDFCRHFVALLCFVDLSSGSLMLMCHPSLVNLEDGCLRLAVPVSHNWGMVWCGYGLFFPEHCVHTEGKGECLIRCPSWVRIFSCTFLYKVALVKSPSAFRQGRLAQSVCVCVSRFWARHFPWKFPYNVALGKFFCAFRLRRLGKMCVSRQDAPAGAWDFLKWLL